MHDFSIILVLNIHANKKFKIFVTNLSQLDSTMMSVSVPMKQHLASPWGRVTIATLPQVNLESVESLTTYDARRKCVQYLIGLLLCISSKQYTWRNVKAIFISLVTETRPRQVFRRLYDSSIQHATPQQMWRTVTAIHQTYSRIWWKQFFSRLSNCNAPSQLISLFLVTASLVLLTRC